MSDERLDSMDRRLAQIEKQLLEVTELVTGVAAQMQLDSEEANDLRDMILAHIRWHQKRMPRLGDQQ